jgi:predicted aspartyl protease
MRRYVLNTQLLVDPGANTELKLPARKVMQLGLTRLGAPARSRGSTNDISYNLRFFPVLVTATFIRDGSEETVQGALEVKCDKTEYEALQTQQEEVTAGTNEGQSLWTPNQPINGHATTGRSSNHEGVTVIQLTPTRHRPHDTPLQQAVIGMDGLRKLHLHLNYDQLQLEIEEDNLVDDGEA